MKNRNVLDDDRVGKLLLKLSIPAFFGMAVNTLYNIVDTIFIGHFVGTIGIAGLSIVFPVQMLSLGIGQMTGMGGASLISRLIGSKNIPRAERTLGNAVSITVIISLLISIICLSNIDFWVTLLGASETILPYAKDYIVIILFGLVFQTLSVSLSSLIRAEGNVHVPMIGLIGSAVLNIILDSVFIIPMKMGIQGAALATIISQLANLIYFGFYYFSGKSYLKIHFNNFVLEWKLLGEILAIGIASFAMTMATSISTVVVNKVLLNYGGDIAISTYGIINRLAMFGIMPGIVIGQGLQPILGFNYGAQNFQRALKIIKIAIISSTIWCFLAFICLFFIPQPFVSIFTSDPELIQTSSYASKRFFFFIYTAGIIMVGSTVFQSIGKPIQSFISSISRSLVLMVPALLILSSIFKLEGVWITFPVTDLLATLLTVILLIPQIKHIQSKSKQAETKSKTTETYSN